MGGSTTNRWQFGGPYPKKPLKPGVNSGASLQLHGTRWERRNIDRVQNVSFLGCTEKGEKQIMDLFLNPDAKRLPYIWTHCLFWLRLHLGVAAQLYEYIYIIIWHYFLLLGSLLDSMNMSAMFTWAKCLHFGSSELDLSDHCVKETHSRFSLLTYLTPCPLTSFHWLWKMLWQKRTR